MDLKGKKILVTGGASFIGSHLVDALVQKEPASIRVVDDLSSGKKENIAQYIDSGAVEFQQADLFEEQVVRDAVRGMDVVFHLAAFHGGRGVVDTHQRECARNFRMSANMMDASIDASVQKFVYASSGCIYPNYLQANLDEILYLSEEMSGGGLRAKGNGYDPDNTYGADKLAAEIQLSSVARAKLMGGASCRFFTVYGERGKEDHAVIAMIARAFTRQDPFEVWGTGEQVRNWTYVGDIVRGFVRSAEKIDDGTAINLGTMERTRVIDAAKMVIAYVQEKYYPDYNPEIRTLPHMPTGPLNRVADNARARQLLGEDCIQMSFKDGLYRTIGWYFKDRNPDVVKEIVASKLTER